MSALVDWLQIKPDARQHHGGKPKARSTFVNTRHLHKGPTGDNGGGGKAYILLASSGTSFFKQTAPVIRRERHEEFRVGQVAVNLPSGFTLYRRRDGLNYVHRSICFA